MKGAGSSHPGRRTRPLRDHRSSSDWGVALGPRLTSRTSCATWVNAGTGGASRGVVVEGPVGGSLLGRLRTFRYEVRRWRDGRIPDVAYAIASPQHVSDDPDRARRLLDLVSSVPPLKWGRDELR